MQISNNILNKLDKFDQELYIQRFYENKNKLLKNSFKEVKKVNEENNDINLNKIIKGNPLKPKYDINDVNDTKQLINKNKTQNDINQAKDDKIDKKLDFFNQMIVKRREKKKIIENNNNNEIRELFITKKGKR